MVVDTRHPHSEPICPFNDVSVAVLCLRQHTAQYVVHLTRLQSPATRSGALG